MTRSRPDGGEGVAIRPCPFCGWYAEVAWYDGFPSVRCTDCGCTTGMNVDGSLPDAIAAWNKRVHP